MKRKLMTVFSSRETSPDGTFIILYGFLHCTVRDCWAAANLGMSSFDSNFEFKFLHDGVFDTRNKEFRKCFSGGKSSDFRPVTSETNMCLQCQVLHQSTLRSNSKKFSFG